MGVCECMWVKQPLCCVIRRCVVFVEVPSIFNLADNDGFTPLHQITKDRSGSLLKKAVCSLRVYLNRAVNLNTAINSTDVVKLNGAVNSNASPNGISTRTNDCGANGSTPDGSITAGPSLS